MKVMWTVFLSVISIDSLLRLVLLLVRGLHPARREAAAVGFAGSIILIAARDEAEAIGPTVNAILPQLSDWPQSRLWVVADNCTDATAEEARGAGALVATRKGGRSGKGAAIDWWMTSFREEWSDRAVIVVLDADSRLDPGSLQALSQAIANGADAAQAFVAPEASRTPGRLAGYSEVLMQRIDDQARSRCRWSVPLRGTGMAFRATVLAELTPRLHTLAEDIELDVLLAARSSEVAFVPEAIVRDPKPRESRGVSNQRARWFQGQLQVLQDYWREILRALGHWRLGTWMLLPMLFLRPKVLFMGVRVFALVVGLVAGAPLWIVGAALLVDLIYYLSGAMIVDDPRRYLLDLASAPRYAALWAYSLGVAAMRRGGWLRAGR